MENKIDNTKMKTMEHIHFSLGPLHIHLEINNSYLANFIRQNLGIVNYKSGTLSTKRLCIKNAPCWPEPMASQWSLEGPEELVFDGKGSANFVVKGDYSDIQGDSTFDEQKYKGVFLAIRLAIEHWCNEQDALSLHAASIKFDNFGMLVVGNSGAGKSTLAKISGATFSDEWSLVYKSHGSWFMAPTPFPRPFQGTRLYKDLKLDAIIFPHHAPPEKLTQSKKAHAIKEILKQTHTLKRKPATLKKMLNHSQALCSQVPSFELFYYPNQNALKPISQAIMQPK